MTVLGGGVGRGGGGSELRTAVATMMADHWRADGASVPNPTVYPWRWLWDSCFHALVWAELGRPDRAVLELRSVLADQDTLGFVPHVRYVDRPDALAAFWGRSGTSSITQPPLYGHAVAELVRRGVDVPADLVDRSVAGVRFLLDRRARSAGGLVTAVHPWETGCDDSPRWDHWCPGGWDPGRWYDVKGRLLDGIERSPSGAPMASRAFGAGSVGLSALVAWNASELVSVRPDRALATAALSLGRAVDRRWDDRLRTWVDDGPAAATSGRVRTVDALLGALLPGAHAGAVFDQVVDAAAFDGPFGPTSVHRREPTFAAGAYWRGSSWPQLTYLLWVAARRGRHGVAARHLARRLVAGARASGLAEHWHPDTGAPLGAVPQSWAGLALLAEAWLDRPGSGS